MTLALLLTAVTGAWAQSTLNVVELEVPADWEGDESYLTAADLPGFKAVTVEEAKAWTGVPAEGVALFVYAFDGDNICFVPFIYGTVGDETKDRYTKDAIFGQKSLGVKFYYTADAITVAWNASTKTGTFSMPGSDVVLTPIYAKAATFATTGTEPEVKTLLPEAAEGVIAGTDASLIAEGTGIVAFAGTSTEVTQGTLMYAVGTSATEAPALDAFNATAPTAENVADDGATVYVWYYIQGADAPDGVAATLDNTFDDTEPACLTVQVLTNKFDITLNAANANTIEAGKATVTVGGTAATVTDGKLQGVKMGSEVKLEAKPGYKFRKVEVKKGGAAAAKLASEVTTEDIFKVIASDGMIYDNVDAAESAGTTAQGLIVYVGSSTGNDTYTHGMALALKDEGDNTWSGAKDACNAKNTSTPIVGALWIQASKDQWNTMFNAVGGDCKLRDCFSSAGGTNLIKNGNYWSSSSYEYYGQQGDYYMFSEYDDWPGDWSSTAVYYNDNYHVRACIVF